MKKLAPILTLLALSSMVYAEGTTPHYIAPTMNFRHFNRNNETSNSLLVGLRHHFTQNEGFNTKINITGMRNYQSDHLDCSLETMYKIGTKPGFSIFPTMTVSHARFGMDNSKESKTRFVNKNRIHYGIGIEKSFESKLVLGLKAEMIHDLSHTTVSELDDKYVSVKENKSQAYKFAGNLHYAASETTALEIEPYYANCLSNHYLESGCKISYLVNF